MKTLLAAFKHLWLGVLLIVAASALLLVSDLGNRSAGKGRARAARTPRIAVMQFASTPLLDDTVAGVMAGLAEAGYGDGKGAIVQRFNAAGDYATANAMARDIVAGGHDLIITASTPAAQVMAAANRAGKTVHVFGAVTDPYGSGIGITGPEPGQHPRHLLGVGTFQPVANAFAVAREMNPALRRVGVVWNPGEHNSEACVKIAREQCRMLGIELIEANAGATSEVPEAVRSVLARGVEAVWVGGDTAANASITTILSAAKAARVPVFTNDPTDAPRGAIFGLGASYLEVGRCVAQLAAQVLRGADPAGFRVDNVVPERLAINEASLAEHRDGWAAGDKLRARAASSAMVAPQPKPAEPRRAEPGKRYSVGVVYTTPHPIFDQTLGGIREGLAMAGFKEGSNLGIEVVHCNGDLSMLPQVVAKLASGSHDAIIPLSTPALAATAAKVRDRAVVFGAVTEPVGAGAGKDFNRHLPNITGAVWPAPLEPGFAWLRRIFPDARRLGVIYNAGEANSRTEVSLAREFCGKLGLELVERSVSNSSEVAEALNSLLATRIDALFALSESTVMNAQSTLVAACRRARIPLLADDDAAMGSGALLACGVSPRGNGLHTASLVARVLLGDDPAAMPFEPTKAQELSVDLGAAASLGLQLPAPLLAQADRFHHVAALRGRPARVVLVNLVDTAVLANAEAGFARGLREAGLAEGVDYSLRRFSAQGEIAQLPAMVDAALATQPDLLVTVTTPALLAAARKVTDIPLVFTVASEPGKLGLFARGRPANITGVHDDPPVDKLLDMARRQDPGLACVGTVYDPSQPNSLISVEKLRRASAERGVRLLEATASSTPEVGTAAESLLQRGARAILLSADNLVYTGFPAILRAARTSGVPIYATEPKLVEQGAAGAIGDDFSDWGAQSGRLAAKVLAGARPADLPILATTVQRVVEPAARATQTKPFTVRIVAYNETAMSEDCVRGLREGLARGGLSEGRDFQLRVLNAQGDMATLSSIMTSVRADRADLLMTVTTPALQAALRQAGSQPTVFTGVGDAVQAGAGKSEKDHLPHVTGITTRSSFDGMARLIRELMPQARRVGTIFSPAELNSVLYKDWLAAALRAEGIELAAIPVTSSAEVAEATAALCRERIDAVCQIVDNTTRPGFAQIARKAGDAGLAVFCFETSQVKDGALLALARDYLQASIEAGEFGARVLRGESPADIPFSNTRSERLLINPAVAERLGIAFPPALLSKAEIFKPEKKAPQAPTK